MDKVGDVDKNLRRTCKICQNEKDIELFSKHPSYKNGRTYYCNECYNQKRTRKRHLEGGISRVEYYERLESNRKTLKDYVTKFWKLVDKKSNIECWLWKGRKNKKGYGIICIGSTNLTLAHRYSYILFNKLDILPSNVIVMHKCNNPICVNPNHLVGGTQKENMLDRALAGKTPAGEKSGRSKLKNREVEEIRKIWNTTNKSAIELARQFNVTSRTVYQLVNNERRVDSSYIQIRFPKK